MKAILMSTFAFILIILWMYFVGVFVEGNFNPMDWPRSSRVDLGVITSVLSPIAGISIYSVLR